MELTQHQFSTTLNWYQTGENTCSVCWVPLLNSFCVKTYNVLGSSVQPEDLGTELVEEDILAEFKSMIRRSKVFRIKSSSLMPIMVFFY